MEDNNELLKYIYQEDLYLINEQGALISRESAIEEEHKPDIIAHKPSIVREAKPVTFFGNNEKGILILVNDAANDLLNQTDLDFLMKIIESGLRYSKNDFAMANTAKFPVNEVMDEISHNFLVSFDNDRTHFDHDPSLYQVTERDGKKVLFADTLTQIAVDQTKKKLLWKALKTMFNI